MGRNSVSLREQRRRDVPGAERARGSVGRDAASHTEGFCLFPKKNGKLLKSFKQRSCMIIFVGIKDLSSCPLANRFERETMNEEGPVRR